MTPNPSCPSCHGTGLVIMADEEQDCPRCWLDAHWERRTLIRRRADSFQVGVLRGEISPFAGEVVKRP